MRPEPAQETLNLEILQTKWENGIDTFPKPLQLRVRRALSWLDRAEKETDDLDAAFIFYWIAFNAAYANSRIDERPGAYGRTERDVFLSYFGKIIDFDVNHAIYDAIWQRFSDSIRLFLNNKYVFQPFWNHLNGFRGYEDWERWFEKRKEEVMKSLAEKETKIVLSKLFDRLYVLRNQLLHGGATWRSSVNRTQVRDGARIMAFLVPHFIDLMMSNPNADWGEPPYPVVKD